MKGIKAVYLHPDNLEGSKTYRIKFRGEVNPNLTIVQEGTFVKLCIAIKKDRNVLGVQFSFEGKGPPQVITWDRFIWIEELTTSSKSRKKGRKGETDVD